MPGAVRSATVHASQLVAADEHEPDPERREQTAVEHAAGAHEGEQFARLAAEVVEVDGDQHQLGADERRDDEVDPEVHDLGGVDLPAPRAHDRELQARQIGEREQHAVRIDRPVADLKQNGMHGVG